MSDECESCGSYIGPSETFCKRCNPLAVLVGLVKECRAAQNQYFQTKTRAYLIEAKNAESRLDKFVADIEREQGELF